jgi:MOSC domain-containing protein YiiM
MPARSIEIHISCQKEGLPEALQIHWFIGFQHFEILMGFLEKDSREGGFFLIQREFPNYSSFTIILNEYCETPPNLKFLKPNADRILISSPSFFEGFVVKLLSVNASLPKEVPYRGKTITTGIFKEPLPGRVMLRQLNLDGDGQADLKGHGGIYKAAYVFSSEYYAHWEQELGRSDFSFGQFGENFTLEGMTDEEVCVGDRFRIGGALVEVTQPRVPCFKLALRMEEPAFLKPFMAHARVGFYLRVLKEGEVGAGDTFEQVRSDPEEMSVREMFNLLYNDKEKMEGAQKALRIGTLSPGWRGSFEEIVQKNA